MGSYYLIVVLIEMGMVFKKQYYFMSKINSKIRLYMNLFIALLLAAGLTSCGNEMDGASGEQNSTVLSDYNPGDDVPTDLEPHYSEDVNIAIQVEGLTGGRANLIGFIGENRYLADTASIDAEGRFVFDNETTYREGVYSVGLPNNRGFQLVLVEDQMDFSMRTVNGQLLESMEVTNSLENTLFYINNKFERENRIRLDSVNRLINEAEEGTDEYEQHVAGRDMLIDERRAHVEFIHEQYPESLFAKFKLAGQNPKIRDVKLEDGSPDRRKQAYHYRNDFWDGVDFSDERLLNTPVIINKLTRYMEELVPQNADSINKYSSLLIDQVLDYPEYFKLFANWVTIKYDPKESQLMDPQAIFVHMIQNYFTYERAFWSDSANIYGLQQRASEMENSLVGGDAPNVRAKGPDGKFYAIDDIDADYIVVYMYNPTCENCKKETPLLVDWYKEWKPKGVEVFAIAIDTDHEEWVNYVQQHNMNWINVFDPTNRSIYATYYVDVTPEIYVINPDRKIIGKNLKTFQIETIINRDKENRS